MTKVNKLKNVVISKSEDTTKEKTEIIQAEIIEECNIDYKTLIMFDVQQEYYKNIKESLNVNSLINAFGGNKKDLFEIEEEELKKIHDKADLINKNIDEIIKEHKEIKKINESLRALNTDISIIQDIYISCYDKTPTSELWLVGNGYIRDIYRIKDIILPYQKNELKEKYNLDDNKLYINYDEFEEIDLYNKSDIKFNKDDITGTLIKIMLSGNCTIEYTTSDVIDINYNGNSILLSIEHLVDWVNNKPTKDYKVNIKSLLKYKEQLYKYKIVK